MGGTPAADMAMGETVGSSSAVPLETSVTLVDTPLEQIADGQHAINVHLSAEKIDTYIACGDIGGQMMGDMLVIGLRELNDSEEVGIALLEGMGDQTPSGTLPHGSRGTDGCRASGAQPSSLGVSIQPHELMCQHQP